ncbi:MAG: DNA alkylation repair protein [Candidatus Micrarchaeia archaeon]|jgi:3-methyladenine DNA glycosylase AlkD
MASEVAKNVRAYLRKVADPKFAEKNRRFFTEPVRPLGVPIPGCTRAVADAVVKAKAAGMPITPEGTKAAAKELYSTGILEEQFCANILLARMQKNFGENDLAFFESIIPSYVDNWACCDGLCSIMGKLYERYPKQAQKLRTWAKSRNRWVKRASVVCLVVQVRRGLFIDLVYSNVSAMLYDSDDLVRKANGWALRQAGKFDEKRLISFLEKHADMPAISLSYAMEKLDDKTRKRIRALRPK